MTNMDLVSLLYKYRFSYDKPQKVYIFWNKINTAIANFVVPIWFKTTSVDKVRKNATAAEDVVVSLTTFPKRIKEARYCVESLLRQSVRPHKIILWIARSDYQDFDALPDYIKDLACHGLEIKFCDDLKSYKKIFYTSDLYKNYRIVTADDDFVYPTNWLKELIEVSDQYPDNIICHRSHRILFKKTDLVEYGKWDWYSNGYTGPSHLLHTLTGAGTLFPKNFFGSDFRDLETIMKYARTADDMWVKVYALRKGCKIVKVRPVSKSLISIYGSQRVSLIQINQSDGNDKILHDLLRVFDLDVHQICMEEE